jgi:hypothetical protein
VNTVSKVKVSKEVPNSTGRSDSKVSSKHEERLKQIAVIKTKNKISRCSVFDIVDNLINFVVYSDMINIIMGEYKPLAHHIQMITPPGHQ